MKVFYQKKTKQDKNKSCDAVQMNVNTLTTILFPTRDSPTNSVNSTAAVFQDSMGIDAKKVLSFILFFVLS